MTAAETNPPTGLKSTNLRLRKVLLLVGLISSVVALGLGYAYGDAPPAFGLGLMIGTSWILMGFCIIGVLLTTLLNVLLWLTRRRSTGADGGPTEKSWQPRRGRERLMDRMRGPDGRA